MFIDIYVSVPRFVRAKNINITITKEYIHGRNDAFMMWYDPYSSPSEWAESQSSNIDNLIEKWDNCKYNPAVIKPFINNDFSFVKLSKLLLLYKNSGASDAQTLDLINMCDSVLKNWVDCHTAWKYTKSATSDEVCDKSDSKTELYKYLIQLGLMIKTGAIDTIIHHYDEIDEHVKWVLVDAIVDLYHKRYSDISCDIDRNRAYSYIQDWIKKINTSASVSGESIITDNTFESMIYYIFKRGVYDVNRCVREIADEIINKYISDENYRKVSNVISDVDKKIVYDVYNYINSINEFDTDKGNQAVTAAMIAQSGYAKTDLCKIAKLCINNINQDTCKITKSCEEAIIKGIMEYKPANELSGIYDVDYELTLLESITINNVAVEATEDDEDDEDDEDFTSRRKPLGSSKKDSSNDKYDSEGYDKPKPKRDFDSEFRKYKSNAERVAQSIDKVAATIKGYALGTNAERGVRKVTHNDSLCKVLVRIFATVAIFDVSKFLGILLIIVRLANTKKVTERERVKLITEIKNEIELIDEQISNGSVETPEARTALLKTKQNLQDALSKIQVNKANYMTDGAKQAVADMKAKNRVK